ncbi:MAG: diguanylate cyclase [Desulfobacteraceae bacterium]|nr:diguanylate cyclase [Desulfobacteraceae bacterium]
MNYSLMIIDNLKTIYSILDNINIGVMVLDSNDHVVYWNHFMEKHSGIHSDELLGKNLFDVFTYLPRQWLKLKLKSVKLIKNYSFVSWTQRPYLFQFSHNRPITGDMIEFMHQNCTFIPIQESESKETLICITIQDMTEVVEFQNKIMEMNAINNSLVQITNHDELTAIFNRSYVEKQIKLEFEKAKRHGTIFSILFLDLDKFKRVNDTYGHLAGDEILRKVSENIKNHLRGTDIFGRYGGEEFFMLLPDTGKAAAATLANRIRKAVEQQTVPYGNEEVQVTISIGVVQFRPDMEDFLQMMHEADIAMYHSKKNGRNTVTEYKITGCRTVPQS